LLLMMKSPILCKGEKLMETDIKKGLTKMANPWICLVVGTGFKPVTFGL
jgi:hypothetical protein